MVENGEKRMGGVNRLGRRTGSAVTAGIAAATVLAVLAAARPAAANTIAVNTTTAPWTPGDGKCGLLEAVSASLSRQALDACPAGSGTDTIQLGAGTYAVGNAAIEVWNSNITFKGASMGTTTIVSSNVLSPSFQTALQPEDCDGRSAAVYVSLSATAAFTDLTLKPAAGVDNMGICVASGSANLTRARVTGFQSRGILALYALNPNGVDVSVAVTSSTIDNNHAYNDGRGGAGIYYRSDGSPFSTGTFTVTSSTISNNVSEDAGGGISFASTAGVTAVITGSTVTGNSAALGGGGISAGWTGGQFDGEALYLNVDTTAVSGNTAGTDGGGIWMGGNDSNTQSFVSSSSITGNHATGRGGGFYSHGQPHFTNTTIGANAGVQGAGFFHEGAESYITQCTIANNGDGSTQAGGGLYVSGGAKIYSYNIFAYNTAVQYSDVFNIDLGPITANYNLVGISQGYVANGGQNDVLDQDAKLGALQNMGGTTLVYPLLAGSPAIDRIPLSPPLTGENALDQRGSPRPQDGDDGAGRNGYDIGAFEQGPIEAEFLTVAAKTSSVANTPITNDANYSMMGGLRFEATATTANMQLITYAYPILDAGTYAFVISVRTGANRGIYQVATANSLTGTYTNRGGNQDLYSATSQSAVLTLAGATVTFATAGTKYIRFMVAGRNARSSSSNLYLDRIQLKKQ